jgi:sugar O-acyltransferase (sialic acid O-acetyltransferase NeuD family)
MKKLVIIGAGGFAREVKWLAERSLDSCDVIGYIVRDLAKIEDSDSRDEILGDESWFQNNPAMDHVAIGIGNPSIRLRIAKELKARYPHLVFPYIIEPSVKYDAPSCRIGEGVLLCAGTVLTVNVTVNDFAMINLNCTVGHEAVIGAGTVINPLCAISGGVKIGDECLIGTHATILQYVHIGDKAVLGAGAVATKNVPAGITAVGVPAKPLEMKVTP